MANRGNHYQTATRVSVDTATKAEIEAALGQIPRAVDRAAKNAVNATIRKAATRVRRGMAKYTTLTQANIKRRMYVGKAFQRDGDTWGNILLQGREFGVINFKTTDTQKTKRQGVFVKFLRSGQVTQFRHAFIAIGKSGNEHVFQRRMKSRLPIDSLKQQSLASLYSTSPVRPETEAYISSELKLQLRSQMDKILSKQHRQ